MGKKPSTKWCLPLCGGCHREDRDAEHKIGGLGFWPWLGVKPVLGGTQPLLPQGRSRADAGRGVRGDRGAGECFAVSGGAMTVSSPQLAISDLVEGYGFSARYWTKLAASGRIPGAWQPSGPKGSWRFDAGLFVKWRENSQREVAAW